MSASRFWVVKPYRVFPPSCRYRQWSPPQIAVPDPLQGRVQGASSIAASRGRDTVSIPLGRFQGPHLQQVQVHAYRVSIPLRKVSRVEEPASVRDVLRRFPSLSDTEHVMANPLSYPVQGAPVPVTVNEVYKRTASSGEAAERPAQPVRQLSDRCNSRCSLMKPLIRPW